MSAAADLMDRPLPFSQDAERGILSCLLQQPEELINDARASSMAEQFYNPGCRMLLELMMEMDEKGDVPVDIVTLSQFLIDKCAMDKLGGPAFLAELLSFVPTPAHYPHYKGILRNKWILRRMIAVGKGLVERAFEFQEEIMQGLAASEAEMFELIDVAQTAALREGGLEPAGETLGRWTDHLEMVIKNRGRITGTTTGINDVDRTLHGLDDKEGECLVLAARPGQGKTAAACSMIDHLVEMRVPTAYFPIEMGTNRTWDRIILGSEGIDTAKSISGMFSREEQKRMLEYVARAREAPIYMDNSPALNTAELRHRVKAAKRKWGIRVLVVDYLGLVDPVTEEGKEQERLALKEVMKTLHYLKRKFSLAVILLVQLSRETDRAPGKAPVLADLSGSADIERYADHVIFIHRPAYYKSWVKLGEDGQKQWMDSTRELRSGNREFWSAGENYPEMNPAEAVARQDYEEHSLWFVRKNRRGPTPDLWVRFQPALTRFSSRTGAIYSNDTSKRQAGYESRPQPRLSAEMDDAFGGKDEGSNL